MISMRTNTMNKLTGSRSIPGAKGFTLVEVMITVAIVAILAMIAYPSYQTYVVRTHRSAAKACLAQYAGFMERYYTTRLTYVPAPAEPDPVLDCSTEGDLGTRYTISVVNRTASTFTVTAEPTTAWESRDTRCGTLSLDDAGARVAGTGSEADNAYCW